MAEHTPEPWEVIQGNYTAEVVKVGGATSMGISIAEMSSGILDLDDANAHFIAASPEMFNALAGLCSDFEQVVAVPAAFTAYNDAMSAIAKAKGETR